eukprot:gnl/Dysnectes_brevis/7037_a11445_366.p1 GENE.gnl/Dysnectes_brevis/7037_a11445_366~~gnl/Dysnectes_brevis/7037_a11445_366.p1  ORF type:complete len:388 (-),score=40.74 gnl/Dysnectes_brevis/7037_a11445_366:15-1178(-)
MKVLLAIDKFKGTLSSQQIINIISDELSSQESIEIVGTPITDGGDDFVQILDHKFHLETFKTTVTSLLSPLPPSFPSTVSSQYAVSRDYSTIFIGMADASGIVMIPPEHRNPLHTSTIGTGELIAQAIKKCRKYRPYGEITLLLGIGGSATNECGMGCLQALGCEIRDSEGVELQSPITGKDLHRISTVNPGTATTLFNNVVIRVACDVDNPLLGDNGSTAVYGPQKGASTPHVIQQLERGMAIAGRALERHRQGITDMPGCGAAGGIAAGLLAMFNATLESGSELVADLLGLSDLITSDTDLVITGEGSFDEQSMMGKAPGHVIDLCKQAGIACHVVCGHASDGVRDIGIAPIHSLDSLFDIETCMRDAEECLRELVRTSIIPILN